MLIFHGSLGLPNYEIWRHAQLCITVCGLTFFINSAALNRENTICAI